MSLLVPPAPTLVILSGMASCMPTKNFPGSTEGAAGRGGTLHTDLANGTSLTCHLYRHGRHMC